MNLAGASSPPGGPPSSAEQPIRERPAAQLGIGGLVSIVVVLREFRLDDVWACLELTYRALRGRGVEFEVLLVDNSRTRIESFYPLVGPAGFPDLQVYVLAATVPDLVAAWSGVDSALGDHVVVAPAAPELHSCIGACLELLASGVEHVVCDPIPGDTTARMRSFHSRRLVRRVGAVGLSRATCLHLGSCDRPWEGLTANLTKQGFSTNRLVGGIAREALSHHPSCIALGVAPAAMAALAGLWIGTVASVLAAAHLWALAIANALILPAVFLAVWSLAVARRRSKPAFTIAAEVRSTVHTNISGLNVQSATVAREAPHG